jgi:predicted metalloprotease with PDZ domain
VGGKLKAKDSIRRAGCVLMLAAAICSCVQPDPGGEAGKVVTVDVTVVKDDGDPHFLVKAVFPAGNLQSLRLTHPARDLCVEPAYEIVGLKNAERRPADQAQGIFLAAEPTGEGPVEVAYEVRTKLRAYDFHIGAVASCDPLVLTNDNFFAEGTALFLRPRPVNVKGEPFRFGPASVSFHGLPDDWSLNTSIAGGDLTEGVTLDAHDDLFGALFAGGRSTALHRPVGGVMVSTYAPGDSPGHSEPVQAGIEKALPYFAKKWGAFDGAAYSIFFVPTTAGGESFGGLVGEQKHDAQYIVHAATAQSDEVVTSAIHELAHWWTSQAAAYMDLDFVREGFTDYIAQRAMYDLGLAPTEKIVERANLALLNMALDRIPQLKEYDEGYVIALALDAKALESEAGAAGFDDVLKRLFTDKADPGTEETFLRVVGEAGLLAPDAPLEKSSILLPCELRLGGRSWRLMAGAWPSYDRQYEKDDANVITAVRHDGAAYRAGLREGDTLVAIESGGSFNVTAPVVLKVRARNGTERSVSYEPYGPVDAQRYPQFLGAGASPPKGAAVQPATNCRA